MLRKFSSKSSLTSTATSSLVATTPSLLTSKLSGSNQVADVPSSSTRKPRGLHRGPGRRVTNTQEEHWYKYVKKWELEMDGEWDVNENFQHLPKPKKLIGNEACEIVWPYAVLLENVIKIHPFTKSLYVYYPQHTITAAGARSASLARRFSRECLIPICFHNSQCYVETEMMLEHSDTAWIVIHCLDGRTEIVRVDSVFSSSSSSANGGEGESAANNINSNSNKTEDELKVDLLKTVLKTATKLGTSVKNPEQISLQLNERPLQNGFIRVDYQWMGDTPEERQSHLVRWIDPEEKGTQPIMYNRESRIADWLNLDDQRPHDPRLNSLYKMEARRQASVKNTGPGVLSNYFQTRYERISSTWSKGAGTSGRGSTS